MSLFDKKFDIDKEFFDEETPKFEKRKIALKVFLIVLTITFLLLFISAFSFNKNSKIDIKKANQNNTTLKDAKEYYKEAISLYELGEYDKAAEYLNLQLNIVDDVEAYNYLAKIYLKKEDIKSAIENFKKAIELKSDFFEPNFELGKIYYSLNDYKTAIAYLKNALLIQDDNIDAIILIAKCYKKSGRADEAIEKFEQIIKLNKENSYANASIGEIYFQRQQYKTAINYLEEAIKISMDENAAIQLAKCYFELGQLEKAKAVTIKILSSNSENPQANSLKKVLEYKMNTKNKNAIVQTPQVKEEIIKPINKEALDKYLQEIEDIIKINWTPPVNSNLKKVLIKLKIDKNGDLLLNQIYLSSGMIDFDKAALDAIEASMPFPKLPDNLNRDVLDIIFTFDFNIKN